MAAPADRWIADRLLAIEASGIRKVFDLARSLSDPVNLSIGQPDFDVPEPVKAAARAAIDQGRNAYTVAAGIAELRAKIAADVRRRFPHPDREVCVTSGTSGGLFLALSCVLNPGDEAVIFDPYFVMYPHLVTLAGGVSVFIDTYPDFGLDVDRVRAALTPRTKVVLVNSPCNPSGRVYPREALRDLARLTAERGVLLISDEIYRAFDYDGRFATPAEFNEDVLVIDGFSKSHGMTGWRLGYAHGPRRLIEEMVKLQTYTFVCAPSMAQYAGLTAWDYDVTPFAADYRRKRDLVYQGLKDRYELARPEGAFYAFPMAPRGQTASDFVAEAIRRHQLLMIPGSVFSRRDSHFRLSYAADDRTLQRGIDILNRMA
jgi:aspartate aminotransferase/aminotransferase